MRYMCAYIIVLASISITLSIKTNRIVVYNKMKKTLESYALASTGITTIFINFIRYPKKDRNIFLFLKLYFI